MIGNTPTQGGMLAALRERGYEVVRGNGADGSWVIVAAHVDGGEVRGWGTTYAAAIRYLYNAIVGDSAPQGSM